MKTLSTVLMLTLFSTLIAKAQDTLEVNHTNDSVQSHTLDQVVVSGQRPNTVIRDNAMVTRIEGTPLQHMGNATIVLSQVPGLMLQGGQLVVIGKGAPIYYINNRKVRDITELLRLSSEQIAEVAIIHSPGAEYEAGTAAVVRINLVRTGEGLSGNLMADDSQSLRYANNRLNSGMSLNYRKKGFDLFGGANYANDHLHLYASDINQQAFDTSRRYEQDGTLVSHGNNDNLTCNLGADWQLSEGHSLGIRVERGQSLHNSNTAQMNEKVYVQPLSNPRQTIDQLLSKESTNQDEDLLAVNAYYSGQLGKWSIDWNADYFGYNVESGAVIHESAQAGLRQMETSNCNENRMWATKAILTYPMGQTKLKMGTELSWVNRNNEYIYRPITSGQDEVQIANADNETQEQNVALFAEWQGMCPVGMFSLGLRYEHVGMNYDDKTNPQQSTERDFDHLFPSASFATRIQEVQAQVSYRVKTQRPSFSALRSNVEYLNRFTLSTGDPTLRPELTQQANLNLRWRYLAMSASYMYTDHALMDWFYLNDDQGGVLSTHCNLSEPLRRMSLFVVASPTIRCWHPNYTVGIQKQKLGLTMSDPSSANGLRTLRYNRPMWIAFCNNAFVFTHGWQVEANADFYSKAHWGTAELTDHFLDVTFAIQKSWLPNEALTLRLSAQDLFQRAKQGVAIKQANYTFYKSINNGQQRSVYDSHCIALHLSYKFNHTKSRYKGQSAGEEVVNRIKK